LSGGLILLMIGDELLDGRSRDTNSDWIIARTREEGWRVDRIDVVGDDVGLIASAIRRHARTAAAIIVSGGLGPTVDDITREGLAAALEVELEFDPEILSHIESMFERRGRRMPPSNRRQAMRTPNSRVIPNPVGSAVGLFDTCDDTPVALLPGVPAELKSMFDAFVREEFAPRLSGSAPLARRLRTSQVAESALVELVDAASSDLRELDLAYCVSTWGVDLLIRGRDRATLDRQTGILLEALGDRVFGEGDLSLPAAVIEGLRRNARTVAVAESCTGGLLGGALTSVPGCSAVFKGGVIAYDNEIKKQALGVDPGLLNTHGAVSEEVACAMAAGVRHRLDADWGVSTTGIAGPDGGSQEKPVGTVCVGLAGPGSEFSARTIRLGGDRDLIRRWTVAAALDALRRGKIGRR
jgi:nicotinamide-nucleotide amidase